MTRDITTSFGSHHGTILVMGIGPSAESCSWKDGVYTGPEWVLLQLQTSSPVGYYGRIPGVRGSEAALKRWDAARDLFMAVFPEAEVVASGPDTRPDEANVRF
jgi:hypothetical protein